MNDRHLSWQNLQRLIENGAPVRIAIPGEPRVEIIVEAGGQSVAMVTPLADESKIPLTTLAAVRIDCAQIEGAGHLRVMTFAKPLFQEFYSLIIAIADSIQLDQVSPVESVIEKLESWRSLLRAISLLSPERQLGLLGELWVLSQMIENKGSDAIFAWTGPTSEPHDFRFGCVELEIKTTRNRKRLHKISSIDQLVPSPDRTLYLVSLQFEPSSGPGTLRLKEAIAKVRLLLSANPNELAAFNRMLLNDVGYRDDDSDHYVEAYQFRSRPLVLVIDDNCPRITKAVLQQGMGETLNRRISGVSYCLDCEGLGEETDFASFLKGLAII